MAEGDIVQAMPVPEAKLGGSYVWVRGSAQIKPGSIAATAAAAPAPTPRPRPMLPPPLRRLPHRPPRTSR